MEGKFGIAVTGPGVLGLVPAPPVPSSAGARVAPPLPPLGETEVAGESLVTLISPGTELAAFVRPAEPSRTRYPAIPGYAAVWRVQEVGSAVTAVRPGDIVLSQGGHRSRQREREDLVWQVPAGLDPAIAVFARLMLVPMAALGATAARPGARVGVSGLGPVGQLAAAIFARCGFDVVAWDPQEDRRALVSSGVRTVDGAPEVPAGPSTGSVDGLDLVLECSGSDGAALAAVRTVRAGGDVILVGAPWRRRTDATAHDLLREVFHRYAVLRSGWEWQVPAERLPFGGANLGGNVRTALRWLRNGDIRVEHLADAHPPSAAQAVYDGLADGTLPRPTALFDWRTG
ncbi:MAG TPA: hypothetical protein VIL55_08975 [Naasia sp.]|jgi:threonine dehydrogenase-like Zn-dependent dehydrogenase